MDIDDIFNRAFMPDSWSSGKYIMYRTPYHYGKEQEKATKKNAQNDRRRGVEDEQETANY